MVFDGWQRDERLGGEERTDDVSEEVDDDDLFDIVTKRVGAREDERGGDGGEDEPSMRDAGKRERALHISRGEGAEIAEEEGQDGGDAKERRELHGNRRERSGGEEYEGERAGGLGGRAEEGGGGRRGALVDVRNPGVERESPEFEGDAAEDEGDAGEREGRDRVRDGLGGEGVANLGEVERVGDAGRAERTVDEHDTHQEQRGAKSARDEVFHAGFERGLAAAEVADEHVEADGSRLEREEERDEMVRLREEHERGGHD